MNELEQRQDRLETQLDILTNGLIKANQEITKLKRDRDDLWHHVSEGMQDKVIIWDESPLAQKKMQDKEFNKKIKLMFEKIRKHRINIQ